MYRQTILLSVFSVFLSLGLVAQSLDKVSILPVKYSGNKEDVAGQVANLLYDELVVSKRVEVFPVGYFDGLLDSTYQKRSSDQIDDKVLEKAKQDNANYLLSARIVSCKVEKEKKEDSNDYNYACTMNVGLRLIDVSTQQTKHSHTLNFSPFMTIRWNTEGQAIDKAVKGLKKDFEKFIDKAWPVEGAILQASVTNRKGEIEEVILNIGAEDGVEKNDKLKVVEKSNIGPNQYNVEIGEIQITAVNGPKLSTGKVRKGRGGITTKLDEGVVLNVITKNN